MIDPNHPIIAQHGAFRIHRSPTSPMAFTVIVPGAAKSCFRIIFDGERIGDSRDGKALRSMAPHVVVWVTKTLTAVTAAESPKGQTNDIAAA